jgi:acyl-CoA reductase-like NAD-dependent aldehyde dehydrogenase
VTGSTVAEFRQVIDGRAVASAATFEVLDPATGELLHRAPDSSRSDVDAAMTAAARAFPAWAADEGARHRALVAAADTIVAHSAELAEILVREQGKPLIEATNELRLLSTMFRYYGELDVPREVLQDDDEALVVVRHLPLGPVVALTPWNIPLTSFAMKAGPTLAAGNTVVLKPSPFTPLATLRLGELLNDVLPAGVLNIVCGGADVGSWLTEHPLTRMITMTGSTATGKKVAAAAVADLKRVTLELGGNDPAIVLEDADPDEIADRLYKSAFYNSGQICIAVKRLYVHEGIHDRMVDALADRARSIKLGHGLEPDTQMGPVNNPAQLSFVSELTEDARARGGRVVAGGAHVEGPGYFFEPTIVAGLHDGDRLVDEEQFGPVLPIVAYRDVEEVVRRTNSGRFGLGGSVWSADLDRAAQVAGRLEVGTAWVNTHIASAFPRQPMSGLKWSGLGVENGPWGLLSATEVQVLYQARR